MCFVFNSENCSNRQIHRNYFSETGIDVRESMNFPFYPNLQSVFWVRIQLITLLEYMISKRAFKGSHFIIVYSMEISLKFTMLFVNSQN